MKLELEFGILCFTCLSRGGPLGNIPWRFASGCTVGGALCLELAFLAPSFVQ